MQVAERQFYVAFFFYVRVVNSVWSDVYAISWCACLQIRSTLFYHFAECVVDDVAKHIVVVDFQCTIFVDRKRSDAQWIEIWTRFFFSHTLWRFFSATFDEAYNQMRNLLLKRSGRNVRGYQWFCTTSRFHTLHALMRAKFSWCLLQHIAPTTSGESCRIFSTLVERKPNDLLRLLWMRNALNAYDQINTYYICRRGETNAPQAISFLFIA